MIAFTVLLADTGAGRKNAFCSIAQNAFFLLYYSDERLSAGDEDVESARFKLPPNTATHVATSDFQAELLSILLLTGTHLRKWAVATNALVLETKTLKARV